MIQDAIVGALLISGAALIVIAGIGAVRMPDLFTRMQATTKAAVLGMGLILVGVAVHFGEVGVTSRALAAIAFIGLTGPIAAHLLGRAAYFLGVPLWEGSVVDELRDRYDWQSHRLRSEARDVHVDDGDLPPAAGRPSVVDSDDVGKGL